MAKRCLDVPQSLGARLAALLTRELLDLASAPAIGVRSSCALLAAKARSAR